MASQSSLKELFQGKIEVVEASAPAKKKPGPKPKGRPKNEAHEDAVLASLEAVPYQHELLVGLGEGDGEVHRPLIMDEGPGANYGVRMRELSGMAGKSSPGKLKLPGAKVRRAHEGPQLKLQLCEWVEDTSLNLGGGEEVWDAVLLAAAEEWGKNKNEIEKILKQKKRWVEECAARGVGAKGLLSEEYHLPRALRKNRGVGGVVMRAKGAGRKDELQFLYPLVRDYFQCMREHAKYIDAVDLEEHLQLQMVRFIEKAEELEARGEVVSERSKKRVVKLREELGRLRDPRTKKSVHQNRQSQLMRFCDARLRKPQRLARLSLGEEKVR